MNTPRIAYDEMHAADQRVRDHYTTYDRWLGQQPDDAMRRRREEAEVIFRRVGITFAVYGDKDADGAGTERLIPFDLIPRIIPAAEWRQMEKGLRQRVTALNRFIRDVYNEQAILKAGVIPAEQVLGNAQAVFPYEYPALFSMAIAFTGIWFFSITDKSAAADEERARFIPQFVRSQTGLGASGAVAH